MPTDPAAPQPSPQPPIGTPPAPIPSAPPTSPGPIAPREKNTWPSVLGVICLVIGILGTLSSAWSIATLYFTKILTAIISATGQNSAPVDEMMRFRPLWLTLYIVMILLSFLLAFGSIRLIQRRHAARKLLLTWSVLRLLAAVVISLATARIQSLSTSSTFPSGLPAVFIAFSLLFGFAFQALLPIYLLFWLNRAPIRAQCARWPHRAHASHPTP